MYLQLQKKRFGVESINIGGEGETSNNKKINNNSIKVKLSVLASVLIVVIPFSSVFSGMMMDNLGRLNTIKIAGIPGVIGWSIIAVAPNVPWIIFGRLLVGISAGHSMKIQTITYSTNFCKFQHGERVPA